MFNIRMSENQEIMLSGRFDASQVDTANAFFEAIETSHIVNFEDLDYISSAGLGVLLAAQKRLKENGYELTLIKLNKHILDIFKWAGFDMIIKIKAGGQG